MEFDYLKNQDTPAGWALIHLMTKALPEGEKINEYFKHSGGPINIKLTFNGVEADFVQVINTLTEFHDDQIKKKAQEMIDEKLGDELSEVHQHLYELKLYLQGKVSK